MELFLGSGFDPEVRAEFEAVLLSPDAARFVLGLAPRLVRLPPRSASA